MTGSKWCPCIVTSSSQLCNRHSRSIIEKCKSKFGTQQTRWFVQHPKLPKLSKFYFPFKSEPSQLTQYQSNIHESQVCWLNPNYWNSKIWSTTLWVLSTQGPPSVSHCCRPHLATAQRSRHHSTPRIAPVASCRQWADCGLKKRHKINGESRLPPMMAMITTYFKYEIGSPTKEHQTCAPKACQRVWAVKGKKNDTAMGNDELLGEFSLQRALPCTGMSARA